MFSRSFSMGILLAALCAWSNAQAAPATYTDQSEFLFALAALSSPIVHEGFEGDAAWGLVRTDVISGGFVSAPTVSNLGLTWFSNNLTSGVTTSAGAARSGEWGLFSYPHGSNDAPDPGSDCTLPGDCGDGFRGAPEIGVLYGIGGWLRTNTPLAEVGLFLGAYAGDPEGGLIDLTLGTSSQFIGVIDPDGFTAFEFREVDGTSEDRKFLFADDFYFAGSHITPVPLPAPLAMLAAGLGLINLGRVRQACSRPAGSSKSPARHAR